MNRLSNIFWFLFALAWLCAPAWGQVPPIDARETEWSAYVATQFEKEHSSKCKCEYRLPDESRIDIYEYRNLGGYASYEIERCHKWKEGIGQALYYQLMTNSSEAGVVLIALGDPDDKLNILRCKLVCQKVGLRLYVVDKAGVVR